MRLLEQDMAFDCATGSYRDAGHIVTDKAGCAELLHEGLLPR